MKTIMKALILAGGLAGSLMVTGCTQLPTEKQSISDMRPQISFKAEDIRAKNARVILDDLDMGMVGNYLEGSAALRILPGSHELRITSGNEIILAEKFYAGDGVNRTFIVKLRK
jgi:hypothetical protein